MSAPTFTPDIDKFNREILLARWHSRIEYTVSYDKTTRCKSIIQNYVGRDWLVNNLDAYAEVKCVCPRLHRELTPQHTEIIYKWTAETLERPYLAPRKYWKRPPLSKDDWNDISMNNALSITFVRKNRRRINWTKYSLYAKREHIEWHQQLPWVPHVIAVRKDLTPAMYEFARRRDPAVFVRKYTVRMDSIYCNEHDRNPSDRLPFEYMETRPFSDWDEDQFQYNRHLTWNVITSKTHIKWDMTTICNRLSLNDIPSQFLEQVKQVRCININITGWYLENFRCGNRHCCESWRNGRIAKPKWINEYYDKKEWMQEAWTWLMAVLMIVGVARISFDYCGAWPMRPLVDPAYMESLVAASIVLTNSSERNRPDRGE